MTGFVTDGFVPIEIPAVADIDVSASATEELMDRNTYTPTMAAELEEPLATRGTEMMLAGIRFTFTNRAALSRLVAKESSATHSVVVLCGRISHLPLRVIGREHDRSPRRDSVWIIPSGARAQLWPHPVDGAEVCHVAVPVALCTDLETTAAHDALIHHLIERIRILNGRVDASASLLRESLAEVFRLHLRDQYAARARPGRARRLQLAAAHCSEEAGAELRVFITEFVDGRLDKSITMSDMAASVGISSQQFTRIFGRAMGTTPHQFVIQRRVERAKVLLTTTSLSITDISMKIGFSTPSHFATTFKLHVGETPSAFRQTN